MKKKWTKSSGFTLAELLIVVAIIAVLVAISIPIFTSQLEKAREATDLSDVRSAYAEVMMAAISDDTTATYSKDPNQTIHKSNGLYSVTVSPLHQEQDNWQGNMDLNVGGVSSKDTTHWIGTPKATGSCEVSYNPQGDSVVLNWSGKSTGGGNTGGGGTVTPGGSTTGGGSTPAPNPGTGGGTTGGTTGGDTNQGNSGSGSTETPPTEPGNNTPDTKPTEPTDKTPETEKSAYETLKNLADTYPTEDRNYKRGSLYFYHNKLFVCKTEGEYSYDKWYKNEPDGNIKAQFPEITEDAFQNCLHYSDLTTKNDGTFLFQNIKYRSIYIDPNGNYFIFVGGDQTLVSPTNASPPDNTAYTDINSNWVPILPDTHNRS